MFQRDLNDKFIGSLNALGYMPILVPQGEIAPPAVYILDTTRNRYHFLRPLADLLPRGTAPLESAYVAAVSLGDSKASKKGGEVSVSFLKGILEKFGLGTPRVDVNAHADAGAEFSFEETKMRSVAPGRILDALNAGVKPAAFGSELDEGLVHIGYEYLYSSKVKIETGADTAAKAGGGVQAASVVNIAANVHADWTGKAQRNYQGEKPVAFAFAAARLAHDGKAFALDFDAPAGAGVGPGVQTERKVVRTGQVFDFTE